MSDEMGSFRITVEIESQTRPGHRERIENVLVDTDAELSWFPATLLDRLRVPRWKQVNFRQADGSMLTRWTGPAWIYAAGTHTSDEVVFGEPRDLVLLGARTLEGLNLRIDPVRRILVDAGPLPAAAAA